MCKHIDYAYKSYVLNEHSELVKKQRRASKYDNLIINALSGSDINTYQVNEDGVITSASNCSVIEDIRASHNDFITSYDLYRNCLESGLEREYYECVKINHATYERTKRLKERVKSMLLNGSCIFLTLTFTDTTLKDTTAEQRRKAVARYLKQHNCMYIANIDFGKDKTKTMREHYHALINCDKVDFTAWRKYGNINAERVRSRNIDTDKTRLSKYIAKLSNHAIKETTKRSSLMYSR